MPHIQSEAIFTSEWRIFGASLQGLDHIKRSLPCQDSFEFGTSGGLTWIAVADGLSGELNSDFGAQLAVRHVSSMIRNTFAGMPRPTHNDIYRIFECCREELYRQAELIGCHAREFSTTLQLALLDMKSRSLHYAVLGDGGCVVSLCTREWFVLGDRRARPSIGTAHLLQDGGGKYMHVETFPLDSVDGVFVFTDGLNRLFLQRRSAENIGKRVNTVDAVALREAMFEVEDEARGAFLLNTAVAAHQDDIQADDKTIVAAIRLAPDESFLVSSTVFAIPDHQIPGLHDTALEMADTALSVSENNTADSSESALGHSPQFYQTIREQWLPWLQTIFLILILVILFVSKIHFPYDMRAKLSAWLEESHVEMISPYY